MTVGDYKNQDDFILVRRFMSTELGITSKNEMLLYALIYSYSDGGSAFYGSTEYLARRLGSSKSRIIKCLNDMVERGLIIKKSSGRYVFYMTNYGYVCNAEDVGTASAQCQYDTGNSVSTTPNNISDNIKKDISVKRFSKPTLEEIQSYCDERNNNLDIQQFFDYYESKGWRIGNSPMKDWKAAVRTWERNNFKADRKTEQKPAGSGLHKKTFEYTQAPTVCPKCGKKLVMAYQMPQCPECSLWYEKEGEEWKMYQNGS